MRDNFPWRSVMVVTPHGDDESLGCGGSIAKFADVGIRVMSVCVAVNETRREAEFAEAAKTLRVHQRAVLYGPAFGYDGRLNVLPMSELVQKLDEIISSFKPDAVFAPSACYHQDHGVVENAVVAACRPASGIRYVLQYEYPGSSWALERFDPRIYIRLDPKHVDAKLRAIRAYRSQARKPSHIFSEQSARELAKVRGREIGEKFAESFNYLRCVYG